MGLFGHNREGMPLETPPVTTTMAERVGQNMEVSGDEFESLVAEHYDSMIAKGASAEAARASTNKLLIDLLTPEERTAASRSLIETRDSTTAGLLNRVESSNPEQ